MSIWSTFKTIKTHDVHAHRGQGSDRCDCPATTEVWLSKAWAGFPLRLTVDTADEHADAALSRTQARELAQELLLWADEDERREVV